MTLKQKIQKDLREAVKKPQLKRTVEGAEVSKIVKNLLEFSND